MKNPAGVYPKLALPLTRLDVDLVLFQPFLLDALLQPLVERVLWTDEAIDLMVLAVDPKCCGLETKFFPHINLHLVAIFVKIFLYFQDVMVLILVALRGFQVELNSASDFVLIRQELERRKIEVYHLKLAPNLRAKLLVYVPVLSLTDSAAVVRCVASGADFAVWGKANLEKDGN